VWNGLVVALDGDAAGLPARRVVDAGGTTVLPGFIDAHTHLCWARLAAAAVRVPEDAGVDQVLETVRAAAARTPGTGWVEVAGYDVRPVDRPLCAADLDTVSRSRPIYVQDRSGHACVVNSAVLERLPEHYRIAGTPGVVLDPDGRPTGGLAEAAQQAARVLRLPYSVDEVEQAIAAGARQCLAVGVTLCAEAGIGAGLIGHSPVEAVAYQRALEHKRLPIRMQLMVSAEVLHPVGAHPADGIARGLDLGLRTGFGDQQLSLGALKVFLDGGMMARTAALTSPYRTGGQGQLQDSPDRLCRVVVEAHAAGWQLAMHAIGDRAVDLALDAVEEAQRCCPRPQARHRIEHCGLVRPDQLDRLAVAGVAAVVQPSFLWAYGDDYASVMGPQRAPWMYRGRSFLDRGIPLAGSSDRPVACGAPLRAIQFMVQRTSSQGLVIGPDEALTVEQALHAYTRGGAYACGREHLQGSITTGKLADLVVLADDPVRVDPARIAEIEVLATYIGGWLVHPAD
ncbi:MAG TPA: amidohydrolase, partial [Pseudonocardiaceae bacterium]|nr:amidohydrolase [Pseudonocardiaceae bacterium]